MNKRIFIILIILLIVFLFWDFKKTSFSGKTSQIFSQNQDVDITNLNIKPKIQNCLIKHRKMIVRGSSLNPFIKPGQGIEALFGYYKCHKIKRGDVVLFDYAGDKNFIIKIVKGIPGDKFELRKSDGGWNIIINDNIIKNSENKPYLILGNAYKMLSLYEKDYKGIIPEDAYLLLGNRISGSIDSTAFGLVNKSGIVAKVKI